MKNSLIIYILFFLLFLNCNIENRDNSNKNINPLLQPFNTPFELPPFSSIKDEHFIPAIKEAIIKQNLEIDKIINCKEDANFENTILAFDTSGIILDQTLNIFNALISDYANKERMNLSMEIYSIVSDHKILIYQWFDPQ